MVLSKCNELHFAFVLSSLTHISRDVSVRQHHHHRRRRRHRHRHQLY